MVSFGHNRDSMESRSDDSWRFPLSYYPSRIDGKHYVVNADTDKALGIVSNRTRMVAHGDLVDAVQALAEFQRLGGRETSTYIADGGGWFARHYTFNVIERRIATARKEVTVHPQIILWHSVTGTAANSFMVGLINSFCWNGLVTGDYSTYRRRNSGGFDLPSFAAECGALIETFHHQTHWCDRLARSPLDPIAAEDFVRSEMFEREKSQERMIDLVEDHMADYGPNVWALYQAMTNYSTYSDARNGFELRLTQHAVNDNRALRLAGRRNQVQRWITTPRFQSLLAA